jgi:hypothetical protein
MLRIGMLDFENGGFILPKYALLCVYQLPHPLAKLATPGAFGQAVGLR